MCEILVKKQEKGKSLNFSESSIEEALYLNDDGAGYVVFKKDEKAKGWEVVEVMREDLTGVSFDACGYDDFEEYYRGYASDEDKKESETWKESREKEAQAVKDRIVDNFYARQEKLTENELLIMHFRNATSGNNGKNTQPIIKGNYCVIHNGIFSNMGNSTQSDTSIFTSRINAEAKVLELGAKDIEAELEMLNMELTNAGGFYSIFIYSWTTKQLYYFKSSGASFVWSSNKVFGATKEGRLPTEVIEGKTTVIK